MPPTEVHLFVFASTKSGTRIFVEEVGNAGDLWVAPNRCFSGNLWVAPNAVLSLRSPGATLFRQLRGSGNDASADYEANR